MKNMRKKSSGVYEARIRIHPWEKITYKSLGTKDKTVAQERLNKLHRQMELEAEGIVTPQKMKAAAERPLADLIREYLGTLEAGQRYIDQTGSRLKRLCAECGWKRIKDIDSLSFQQWKAEQSGYTPKTKNHFLSSIHSFCAWLVDHGLAAENPMSKIKPVKVRGKHAFQYRALSMDELNALIALPGHRSIIYRVGAYTGLRHGEMKALQWGDVQPPYLIVRAETTKNGEAATIKLHSDLLPLLETARPAKAKSTDPVFPYMPDNRTVKRDFQKTGIETDNERGEKASFHSLRNTFCQMLHDSGVPHRVAQEAMRHSDPKLTNNVYYDRSLTPLAQAIDSLPSVGAPPLAPPRSDFSGHFTAQDGAMAENGKNEEMANFLEKQKECSVSEAFLVLKEWCTRMESNHHAIAGTRT